MKFYEELRKADGSEYEPACLRVMRASLDRYLKEKKYPVSLLDMEEFKESNLIFEGEARDLRDRGMGNRPDRALPITKREEEILWECGQLGCNSAQSLINTLWWLLTQHFGLRGRQEHYPMLIEDLQFGTDVKDWSMSHFLKSEQRQGREAFPNKNVEVRRKFLPLVENDVSLICLVYLSGKDHLN